MNVIKNLSPKILSVSQKDPKATYKRISDALIDASSGDQIIVENGQYDLKLNGEKFPLYLPPRCHLIGSGSNKCIIDGTDAPLRISSRPVDPNQSLLLLGDHCSVSGFTICNSKGNGVSNEQGSHFMLSKCTIRDNGQHGLLIFGTNGALIQNNHFENNGTSETLFKAPNASTQGKQGHQIFIEGRSDSKNAVTIIGNKLQKVFADGIDIDIFDQPDGIMMDVRIIGNTISDCGRFGFALSGSYGPSNSNVFLDVRNNIILNTIIALDFQASYSLIHRTVYDSKMFINIISNHIKNCDIAINGFGAISPAVNCKVHCNLIGNHIVNSKEHGISLIGGVGLNNWPAENNSLFATVANNNFVNIGKHPIFAQGGISSNLKTGENVKNNLLSLHLVRNKLNKGKIVVNDGLTTNMVNVVDNSQSYTREKNPVIFTQF